MPGKPNVLELSEDDLRAFSLKHGDALVALLNKMKEKGKPSQISWSWLGFLLPLAWFAYRRMWLWMLGVVAAIVLLITVEELFGFGTGNGASIGLCVAVGMLGKQWVIERASKAAAEADAQGLVGEARTSFLSQQGGVSVVGAWITGVVLVGLVGLSILLAFGEI